MYVYVNSIEKLYSVCYVIISKSYCLLIRKNDRNAKKMLEIFLPHSSRKLELPMNFDAIFKNVKIIKIGLLDAKL